MFIKSIYDDYDLYSIILGRDKDVKMFEAQNAVIAAEQLLELREAAPLRILELFAGRSEHEKWFRDLATFPIARYDCLDNVIPLSDEKLPNGVVYGDAVTGDFEGYDLLIAHYFSLNGPIIKHAQAITRKDVVRHLKNVVRNFKAERNSEGRRGYYIHIGDIGVGNTLNQVLTLADETATDEVYVRPHHPIRSRFNLPARVEAHLTLESHASFDRWTRTILTHYFSVELVCEDRTIQRWEIKDPFPFRTWSEDEMVDMIREAGFTDAVFFHNRRGAYADNSEHCLLMNSIQQQDVLGLDVKDDEETGAFNATEILAIY